MIDLDVFDAEELVAFAKLDIESQRLDGALQKLKQAYTLPGAPSEIDSLLAKTYAELKLFDRAAFHYEACLAREPEAVTERFQYGMIHFDQGMKSRALAIWEDVLQLWPTHEACLFYASLVHAEQGEESETRRKLDILFKSAPIDNLYLKRGKGLLQELDRLNGRA